MNEKNERKKLFLNYVKCFVIQKTNYINYQIKVNLFLMFSVNLRIVIKQIGVYLNSSIFCAQFRTVSIRYF